MKNETTTELEVFMRKSFTSIIFLSIFISAFCMVSICIASSAKNNVIQLKAEMDNLKIQVDTNTKDIDNFKALIRTIVIFVIIANLAFWGSVILSARKTVKKVIDKAIYKVDPTYMEVKIPDKNFDNETKRLEILGFKNLKKYPFLDDSCLSGCVIFAVDNKEQSKTLKTFLEDKKPNEYKVGYIIYIRQRIDYAIFEKFNNITFSNSPLTLVNAVYAVARGIAK